MKNWIYWIVVLILSLYIVSCEHYIEVEVSEQVEQEYDACFITKKQRSARHGLWEQVFIYKSEVKEPKMIFQDKSTEIFIFCQ